MGIEHQSRPNAQDVRCTCGQLVARWTSRGLEIKCKRCRRLVYVPLASISGSPPRML